MELIFQSSYDAQKQCILCSLLWRELRVRQETRMLFSYRIFHLSVLPSCRRFFFHPRIVTIAWSAVRVSYMELDPVNRAVALPLGCLLPLDLRHISDGLAVSPIRLMAHLCNLFY